jgi:hypothetical protein
MLLRSQFSDHMPRLWWLEYFPRGHEVDASRYQPLNEVIDIFEPAGWRVADFGTITELSSGPAARGLNACACVPIRPSPTSRPTS